MCNAVKITKNSYLKKVHLNNLDYDYKHEKKVGGPHFQYQFIKCQDCGRKLKICQIQRKRISNCREFAVFTYYCRKCKFTYFIFKFINKNEVK